MYAIILYIYAGMENEMRHKIVLMTGGTETLEFFSLQLKKGFEALGYLSLLTLTVFIMRLHFLT